MSGHPPPARDPSGGSHREPARDPLSDALSALGRDLDGALRSGPRRCGPYQLLSEIAEGAYGVIYAAVQDPPISRRVAIKVLKRGLDTDEILRRFALEQHVLGRIDHPAVTPILDAGSTTDGRPWFAMPLLEGGPITSEADAARLTIRDRVRLFARVCDGVNAAHVRGVVHRDLKPSNILLVCDSEMLSPRIIDFGVARAIEGEAHHLRTQTAARGHMGTLAYMAPEQHDPEGIADLRSDVYSLGVVLAELLTGVAPRPGDSIRPAASSQVKSESIRSQSEALARAEARQLESAGAHARALRGDLNAIIAHATMPEPHLRYQSASAMADDLRRWLRHEPITARPSGAMYLAGRIVRKHRGIAALIAVTLAVLAALAAEIVRGRIVADQNAARASIVAQRATEVRSALESVFGGIDTGLALGRDRDLLTELLDASSTSLMQSIDTREPVAAAEIAAVLAKAWCSLDRPRRAEELMVAAGQVLDAEQANLHAPDARLDWTMARASVDLWLGMALERIDRLGKGVVGDYDTGGGVEHWRKALDRLSDAGALETRLATDAGLQLWRRRYAWPEGFESEHERFSAFEAWLEPRVMALPDDDLAKWDYRLRKAEIAGWVEILEKYPPLVAEAERQLGSCHPHALRYRLNEFRFMGGAGVAALAQRTDPTMDHNPGVHHFTDAQFADHWDKALRAGERLIPDL